MRLVTLPLSSTDLRRTAGHTHAEYARPTTRAECRGGVRPCPWVSCKSHLGLDVLDERRGIIQVNPQAFELDGESCAEDAAERAETGELSYEEIGEMMGLSRQSVYQLEEQALSKLRRKHGRKDHEAEGGRTGPSKSASAAEPRAATDGAGAEVA